DLGAVGCGVREGDHPPVAGPPGRVQVGGVHHPRPDRAQQPNVALPWLFQPLEAQVDHDVCADLAVQRDDGGDLFEVEDVHRLAADLAQHDVVRGDIADRGDHAALPALQDVSRLTLVVEPVRPRPRFAAAATSATPIDVDVQQHARTDKAQRGE